MQNLQLFHLLVLCTCASALNILLTNDDSWASANVRATFTALKQDGHDVVLVGPSNQQSGKGGTFVTPTGPITAQGGEFGSVAPGAPFFGQDPTNKNLWYFNGTPAASVVFGIDVIAPMHFGVSEKIDLVVSGPNEGTNLGPFLYTLSGTIGASYAAVQRGIPAVALSAGNSTHRSFTTNTGKADDPANIVGKLTAKFVKDLAKGVNTKKDRLLPLGVGISINFPVVPNNGCSNPPFVLSRLTGGALIDQLSLDPATGNVVSTDILAVGSVSLSGNTRLTGETDVVAGCATSVSVYSVDYDAPSSVAGPIQARLAPLFG